MKVLCFDFVCAWRILFGLLSPVSLGVMMGNPYGVRARDCFLALISIGLRGCFRLALLGGADMGQRF